MRLRVSAMIAAVAVALFGGIGSGEAGISAGTDPEVKCVYVPATHVLRVELGTPGVEGQAPIVFMSRNGDAIRLESDIGPGSSLQCDGGRPTVRNTDAIKIGTVAPVDFSETYLDFGGGPFAPGATSEAGGDEIELETAVGTNAVIHVGGTEGADHWVLGSRRKERYFINFNADERDPDRDLDIAAPPRELSVNLWGGDDFATAKGGAATGGPLSIGVAMIGMEGDDRLLGGPRDDDLLGYGGDDLLNGGAGDDRLDIVGGKGRDTLICGPGRDKWRSSRRDEVRC